MFIVFGGALGDKLHLAGFDVVRPAVVELERSAGGDVELADDMTTVAQGLSVISCIRSM